MKTQPKKVYVSTPYLKRYLIINQLHFTPPPWPRPATYPAVYLATSGDRTLFLIVIEGNIVRYVLENLPAY